MKTNWGLNLLREGYFAWLLTVVLLLAGPMVAHAQKLSDERVALVIGNGHHNAKLNCSASYEPIGTYPRQDL